MLEYNNSLALVHFYQVEAHVHRHKNHVKGMLMSLSFMLSPGLWVSMYVCTAFLLRTAIGLLMFTCNIHTMLSLSLEGTKLVGTLDYTMPCERMVKWLKYHSYVSIFGFKFIKTSY